MRAFLKFLYRVTTVLATVGGAIALFQSVFSSQEFQLSLGQLSTTKVIENNSTEPRLSVLFEGSPVKSLYFSRLQVKNSGTRALTDEFIHEPLRIQFGPDSRVLQVRPSIPGVAILGNEVVVRWKLLNPGEVLDFGVFTTGPTNISTHQKIKEITAVRYRDYTLNPMPAERLKSVGILWWALALLSVAMFIDALLVIKQDAKLDKIFRLTKSLLEVSEVDKEAFLNELRSLYEDYYAAMYWLFVKPDELIKAVQMDLTDSPAISGRELEVARQSVIGWVRHANMYSTRVSGVILGPVLFVVAVFRIAFSLVL